MVWIPSLEYIIAIHEKLIKTGNIINHEGLMSTLDKVKWGTPNLKDPTIWDQVTILYKEIIEFHYFSDGNKRLGTLIAYIFLDKNGYEFSPESGEIFVKAIQVAQGLKSFKDLRIWFENNSNIL